MKLQLLLIFVLAPWLLVAIAPSFAADDQWNLLLVVLFEAADDVTRRLQHAM